MRAAAVQFKATKPLACTPEPGLRNESRSGSDAQARPGPSPAGGWLASASRLCALLEGIRADLIVCPEMALTGYLFPDGEAAARVAEPVDGRTLALASRLARASGAYFVIGYPESAGDGRLYNSALLVGPDGRLLFNYRKRLLYAADESWASPGDTPYPWIETPFGTLTCGICMDINDDGFVDFVLDAAPDVIAFPTNWLDQGFDTRPYWRWRLRGYRGTLVAANTYGMEEGILFRGRSAILRFPQETLALAGAQGDAVIVSGGDL